MINLRENGKQLAKEARCLYLCGPGTNMRPYMMVHTGHYPNAQKCQDRSPGTLRTRTTLCTGKRFMPGAPAVWEGLREALCVSSDVHACTQGCTPRHPQRRAICPKGMLLCAASRSSHGTLLSVHTTRVWASKIFSPYRRSKGKSPKTQKNGFWNQN